MMKRLLCLVLSILSLFLFFSSCVRREKIPDGYVEDSFADLVYYVPEDWENTGTNGSPVYFPVGEGFTLKGLSIYYEDVITTMNDLFLYQTMIFGDELVAETYEEKLRLIARVDLQSLTIEEESACSIDGEKAIYIKASSDSGFETANYYFTTDKYYYHFEFANDEDTITDEFSNTINVIMNSVRIVK